MKNILNLITVFFCTINFSIAQITFQKAYGGINNEYCYSVKQTSDGGYIMAGLTKSFGAGDEDAYIVKTNAMGDTLWTKTFGGISSDRAIDIYQTLDGGYIICGHFYKISQSCNKAFLIKTDVNGDSLWTVLYGTNYSDGGTCVKQTTNGGYIFTGFTSSIGAGSPAVFLVKTDSAGNGIWEKSYGGTGWESGSSLQQTTDGGYIISGNTSSFGAGDSDFYLIKTDSAGTYLWTKTFGKSGSDAAYSVQQTSDGGYIVAGRIQQTASGTTSDIYLIKTNSNGVVLWSKTYGGINEEHGYSVQQTSDGGYIISGVTNSLGISDVILVKTNALGNLLWAKTYGGTIEDWGYSVQQTSDGGYIIGGYTNSFGAGNYDFYLIKTDANGNSGCNEGSPVTPVSSLSPTVGNPQTGTLGGFTVYSSSATITVGSGSIVNGICLSTGINKITSYYTFGISPNPSSGNFTVSFNQTIPKVNLQILNLLGEKVFEETLSNESKKEIHLQTISPGIYFVKLFDGENQWSQKISIE